MGNFKRDFGHFSGTRIETALSDDIPMHPELMGIFGNLERTDRKSYQAIMDYIDSVSARVYKQGIRDGAALTRELLE